MPNIVRFYEKPKLNKAKTSEAGRPIYDSVEMVEVIVAGDKHFRPHFPAHEPTVTYDNATQQDDRRTWAERYPAEYKAYKTQGTMSVSGTPVEAWPLLTRAQVAELKALDIFTVEQIADMTDRNRHILGPSARQIIAQARTYIDQARDTAAPQRLAAENEALRAELERLKAESQANAFPAPMAPPAGQIGDGAPDFDALDDAELKALIKDRTGETPRGNPSRETLLRQARAVMEAA